MSKARTDKAKKRSAGLVLGLAAFEKISAIEGIRLTEEMKRDLHAFDRHGMTSDERTRFITEKYGRNTNGR